MSARRPTCTEARRSGQGLVAGFVLVLLVGAPGCQTLEEIGRLHLRATPEGRKLLERWDHYSEIAEKLKDHHDDGQLDSHEVLEVLVDAGVIDSLPAPAPRPPTQPSPPSPEPSGRWSWPTEAGVISSEFGMRNGRAHEGIDIAADSGEPIYAASEGTVIFSGNGMSGYGNALIVEHGNRTTSLYAHATRLVVRRGQRVSRGTLIATVGSTGRSTGPHLHFEIRVAETPVDPRSVLPRQPF